MNISHIAGSFVRYVRSCMVPDPARDWLVLSVCSVLALAGIVVWNIWAFGTVARGGVIGSAATSTQPVFDRASLDSINALFVDRAAQEVRYIEGVYRYIDPSQ